MSLDSKWLREQFPPLNLGFAGEDVLERNLRTLDLSLTPVVLVVGYNFLGVDIALFTEMNRDLVKLPSSILNGAIAVDERAYNIGLYKVASEFHRGLHSFARLEPKVQWQGDEIIAVNYSLEERSQESELRFLVKDLADKYEG